MCLSFSSAIHRIGQESTPGECWKLKGKAGGGGKKKKKRKRGQKERDTGREEGKRMWEGEIDTKRKK